MKIVVMGGGKVGELVCRDLTAENHDIFLIDLNESVIDRIISSADLMGIAGNGANVDVQLEAGVDQCDVFIAVSATDEVNIMAAIIARRLGAASTIARVRNPEYSTHSEFVRDSLGISLIVNPELEAAQEIARSIRFPSAISVETFANGRVQLVEMRIPQDSVLHGMRLADFRQQYQSVLVCIVCRDEAVHIPTGDFVLASGDLIHVTGTIQDLDTLYKVAGAVKKRIRSALIVGGGRITRYLLRMLHTRMHLKVIEQNQTCAEELSIEFPHVSVIVGDGTDQEFLDEQQLDVFDSFVALTGIDEENVITSMLAARREIPKIVTKVNRTQLLNIIGDVGLQTIVTPKRSTADQIIRFVRALNNTLGSTVENMYRLANDRVEALQLYVEEDSRASGIPLRDLPMKPNLLIAYIVRNDQLIFPTGSDRIIPGDRIIIVTTEKNFDELDDLLANDARA